MSKIKVVAFSDLHGNFPIISEHVDLCLIGGDISPIDIETNMVEMYDWIYNDFSNWLNTIPADKIILIAGNHDAWFYNATESEFNLLSINTGLVYLKNEKYTYYDKNDEQWTIFGTPYCHKFGNFPFMVDDMSLETYFKNIPDDIDIIISHDPPYSVGKTDYVENSRFKYINPDPHCGNKKLEERLKNVNFRLLICGHIHSASHETFIFNKGVCTNVSLVNEKYNMEFEPFYYYLEK